MPTNTSATASTNATAANATDAQYTPDAGGDAAEAGSDARKGDADTNDGRDRDENEQGDEARGGKTGPAREAFTARVAPQSYLLGANDGTVPSDAMIQGARVKFRQSTPPRYAAVFHWLPQVSVYW